jgi:hypothetical protein
VENVPDETHDLAMFSADDWVGFPAFVSQLKRRERPFDVWLFEQLPQETRDELEKHEEGRAVQARLQHGLLQGLNRVLLYKADRFVGIDLRPDAKELMDSGSGEKSSQLLNRLLIEDAYGPDRLKRCQAKSCPPIFLKASFQSPRTSFVADGHHTMWADAFILDRTLGSIGVVHCLGSDADQVLTNPSATTAASDPNPAQPSAPQATQKKEPSLLEGFIRQWIEEAVYLRHLMGMKVDASHLDVKPSTGRVVPSVELVFVLSEKDEVALKQVRDTLILLKRTTSLLHAIGINLVVVPETADPKLDPFDRGFAWLLRHTRTWWGSKKSGAGQAEKDSGNQRLKAIKTTQFRVSGTRIWTLQRPQTTGPFLHLIHGPNGSGK